MFLQCWKRDIIGESPTNPVGDYRENAVTASLNMSF